jgi:hypothetical protein
VIDTKDKKLRSSLKKEKAKELRIEGSCDSHNEKEGG